ncbi:MAG: cation-translocating P-type ATPase [Candidatus Brocadiae bacterium]|nr:cation-translocating P-type ATPase [Candidatus Brocadiia bacterium]
MNLILLRLTRRYVDRRLLQSLLFVAGIALGVAVGVAIDLANGAASRAFSLSVESVTGRTTHQIAGSSGSVPTALYRTLRAELPGYDAYARRVRRVVWGNLFWAFIYNLLAVGLAVTGRLNPLVAALAMVVSSLFVIGNSRRLRQG